MICIWYSRNGERQVWNIGEIFNDIETEWKRKRQNYNFQKGRGEWKSDCVTECVFENKKMIVIRETWNKIKIH